MRASRWSPEVGFNLLKPFSHQRLFKLPQILDGARFCKLHRALEQVLLHHVPPMPSDALCIRSTYVKLHATIIVCAARRPDYGAFC